MGLNEACALCYHFGQYIVIEIADFVFQFHVKAHHRPLSLTITRLQMEPGCCSRRTSSSFMDAFLDLPAGETSLNGMQAQVIRAIVAVRFTAL